MERPSNRPSESLSIDFEDILESSLSRSVAVRTWKELTVNLILVEGFRPCVFPLDEQHSFPKSFISYCF
jgi:hypothetical protein